MAEFHRFQKLSEDLVTLNEEICRLRPVLLLGPTNNLFVNPARIRQVEAPEVYFELPSGIRPANAD